ncbi:MAG TPA: SHOCT domain-containing protein [Arthrobacter sp.]
MSGTVVKRRGWLWLGLIGLAAIVIGIIIGSQKVGRLCGSVFVPKSIAAQLYDTLQGSYGGAADECKNSIASASVPTWILIVLGIVMIVTAFILRSVANRPTVAPAAPAPSVASQIEDLSRLKQQGLVTDEEFEAKRAELLSRL